MPAFRWPLLFSLRPADQAMISMSTSQLLGSVRPRTSGTDEGRKRVIAILACHNRRELTLRAFRSLDAAREVFDISAVLFDDGSTDGTANAIEAEFPHTIIVKGNGDAFWNRGMHDAWSRALELRPDAYLWLNDDVALDADALSRLRDAWDKPGRENANGALILVGATRGANGEITYGGMRRKFSPFSFRVYRLPEAARVEHIDSFNGNIVLITAATVQRIGILDPGFFHMYGDIDYGLRASGSGVPVLLLPGTLGICEGRAPFDLSQLSLGQRWRYILRSPHAVRPASWWRMVRRHSGIFALLHFLTPYRKLFYPTAWLRP